MVRRRERELHGHEDQSSELGVRRGGADQSRCGRHTGVPQRQRLPSSIPILNVPKEAASLSLIYSTKVLNGYQLTGRVSDIFVGQAYDQAYTFAISLPSYNIASARLGLGTDKWTATLFVDNLANKLAELTTNNAPVSSSTSRSCTASPPINRAHSERRSTTISRVKLMCRLMALLACVLLAPPRSRTTRQPELQVTPASGLIDAPFHVVIRGLVPGTRVKVSASRPDDQGRSWTAVGDYLADADGRVDVDLAPSLGGSYEGVSPHGLWCSALPVEPERLNAYLAELPKHPELGTAPHLDASALYTVELTASVNGEPVAHATATRSYAAGIEAEDVASPGVRGRFFPPAAGATPGVPVLVLAGSGGGLPETQAALLASHGHPALAQNFRLQGFAADVARHSARELSIGCTVARAAHGCSSSGGDGYVPGFGSGRSGGELFPGGFRRRRRLCAFALEQRCDRRERPQRRRRLDL